jgi:hypothetical protein
VALLLVMACAVVALAAGLSAAAGDGTSDAVPSVLDDPEIQTAAQRSLEEQRQRDAARDSSAERAARDESRDAYRDLSASEALGADKAQLPDVVNDPTFKPFEPEPGAHVERYRDGDTSAIVETAAGDKVLAESNVPLRGTTADGDRVPVDLTLDEEGARFAAESAPVRASLPSELRNGVMLPVGSGTISVRPVGASADAVHADDDKLLYANAQQDADVLAAPLPTGVELSNIARSPAAPETFAYEFGGLPDGAELRLTPDSHAAEIVDGTDALLAVHPPTAMDADGTPLPVSLSVSGNRLELTVRHRNRDVAYPIVADPPITETFTWNQTTQDPTLNNNTNDFTGWAYNFVPGAGSLAHSTDLDKTQFGIIGTGLYTYTAFGLKMYYGDDGIDSITAPGDAYIYRADFSKLANSNKAGALPLCLNAGIFSRSRNAADSAFYVNCGNFSGVNWGACVTGTYPSCDASAGTGGNDAQLDYWAPSEGYRWSGDGLKYVGGAVIYLNDRVKPTVGWSSGASPPAGWTDSTGPQTLSASDGGLGVKTIAVSSPTALGWPGASVTTACNGTRFDRAAGRCANPKMLSFATTGVPDGQQTLRGSATDVVGNSQSFDQTVKVDRTAPSLSAFTGSLYSRRNGTSDRRNEGLYDSSYSLSVPVSDGGTAAQKSGVKSVTFKVDGVAKYTWVSQCSGQDNCSGTASWTFNSDDYTDGDHTIVAVAKDALADQAGADPARHTTTSASFAVTVDRRGDIYDGRHYSGDPAAGGIFLNEDSIELSSGRARSETDTGIQTRDLVPCEGDAAPGSLCPELRTLTSELKDDDTTTKTFSIVRGAGPADARIERPGSLDLDADLAAHTAAASGPINYVTQPWQTLPPGHGTEYRRYDSTTSELLDGQAGTEQTVATHAWVDAVTMLPIKESIDYSTGTSTYYWAYTVQRQERTELSADFFLQAQPADATLSNSTDYGLDESGEDPIGTASLPVPVDVSTGGAVDAQTPTTTDPSPSPLAELTATDGTAPDDPVERELAPTVVLPGVPTDDPEALHAATSPSGSPPAPCGDHFTQRQRGRYPIPSAIILRQKTRCRTSVPVTQKIEMKLFNARGQGVAAAGCYGEQACEAIIDYHPTYQRFTRQHTVRINIASAIEVPKTTWGPGDPDAAKHCRGFKTPILRCTYKYQIRSVDHRCELERPFFADPNPERATVSSWYDLKETAPYIDAQGYANSLRYGNTFPAPIPKEFGGWGYRHIAAKHGWTTADAIATREALTYSPSQPGRFDSAVTYQQYGIDCHRRVIVTRTKGPNEPAQKGIITSYGSPDSDR